MKSLGVGCGLVGAILLAIGVPIGNGGLAAAGAVLIGLAFLFYRLGE